ncbi:substrate-binding periplasmic protein [Colwelliaceae bacterium 6471]
MLKGSFYLILCTLFSLANSVSAFAEQISVVTEDAYPLQYERANKVKGPATELLTAMLDRAELSYTLEVFPWPRAYKAALNQRNTLIYSIAKTPLREDKFKWVGKIISLDYYLFGLNSLEVESSDSIESLKKYKIGTVRDSAIHEYFQNNNFEHIQIVSYPEQNINMLQNHRIELFPANIASFKISCKKLEFNCAGIVPLYKLDAPSTELYFAFSKNTDDAIVEKVKKAYQDVYRLKPVNIMVEDEGYPEEVSHIN